MIQQTARPTTHCRLIYKYLLLTASSEGHRMGDGVVSVDAERHQDVGGGVGDDHLEEPDELAGQQPRLPRHGHLPDDVRGDRQQSNAEVGQGEVHDEEVHPGPPGAGGELGDEDEGVARHYHGEEQAEEDQLLRLKHLSYSFASFPIPSLQLPRPGCNGQIFLVFILLNSFIFSRAVRSWW